VEQSILQANRNKAIYISYTTSDFNVSHYPSIFCSVWNTNWSQVHKILLDNVLCS